MQAAILSEAARQQLDEAFQAMPDAEKDAYLQAVERAPHVVETESNSMVFLKFHEWDAWAAARRLACYWRGRKEIFGERAFLPLADLSGNGALSPVALQLLISAYFIVLPNDQKGRGVVCYNRDRADFQAIEEWGLQVGFYVLSILMENETNQTDGFQIVVCGAQKQATGFVGATRVKKFGDLIESGFPLRVKALHFAMVPPSNERRFFLGTFLPQLVHRIASFFMKKMVYHLMDSVEDIADDLAAYDLTRDGLPELLGGTWDYDNFAQLLEHRGLLDLDRKPPALKMCQEVDVLGGDGRAIRREELAGELNVSAFREKNRIETSVGETSVTQQERLRQLEEAIEELTIEEKSAYLEAVGMVPDLVATESKPMRFLQFHEWDVEAAARRLAWYWKERKDIFGERAFLPIANLSGNGALSIDDIRFLQSGMWSILPNDREGHGVVVFDRENAQYEDFFSSGSQVLFYLLSALSEDEINREDGIRMLMRFRRQMKGKNSGVLLNTANRISYMKLLDSTFPLRVKSCHIAIIPPSVGRRVFLDAFVPSAMRTFRNLAICTKDLIFHIRDTEEEIAQDLEAYDLTRDGLPASLGGSWKYERFDQGLSTQKAIETVEMDDVTEKPTSLKAGSDAGLMASDGRNVSNHDPSTEKRPPGTVFHDAPPRGLPSKVDPLLTEQQTNHAASSDIDGLPFVETEAIRQEGIRKLNDAFETMQLSDKAAYLDAVSCVPHIVSTESDSVKFLRVERYDPWAAARRLALYWKERVDIFGDRSFLPMDQTGEGALSTEDVELLKTAFAVVLPIDIKGRTVTCIDRMRLKNSALNSDDSQLRCIFYMITVAAENDRTQQDGFVTIGVPRTSPRAVSSGLRNTSQRVAKLMEEALPVRVHSVHLLFLKDRFGPILESIIAFFLCLLGVFISTYTITHTCESGQDVVKKLKEHGIAKRGIPDWLGGSWDEKNLENWQKRRVHLEEERFMTEEEKIERKRRVNAVHSRQKRLRRKIEKEVLQEQCAKLREGNRVLAGKNKQLESLVEKAKREVAILESMDRGGSATLSAIDTIQPSYGGSITAASPWVPRCFSGLPTSSFMPRSVPEAAQLPNPLGDRAMGLDRVPPEFWPGRSSDMCDHPLNPELHGNDGSLAVTRDSSLDPYTFVDLRSTSGIRRFDQQAAGSISPLQFGSPTATPSLLGGSLFGPSLASPAPPQSSSSRGSWFPPRSDEHEEKKYSL